MKKSFKIPILTTAGTGITSLVGSNRGGIIATGSDGALTYPVAMVDTNYCADIPLACHIISSEYVPSPLNRLFVKVTVVVVRAKTHPWLV